jgi:hypothetical protein
MEVLLVGEGNRPLEAQMCMKDSINNNATEIGVWTQTGFM